MRIRYLSLVLVSMLALSGCGGGSDSDGGSSSSKPTVPATDPKDNTQTPDYTFSNEMAADEGEDINQYIQAPAKWDSKTGTMQKLLPIYGTHLGNIRYSNAIERTKIFYPESQSYITANKGNLASMASFEDLLEDKNPRFPDNFKMLSGDFIDINSDSYKQYKGKREADFFKYTCYRALTLGKQELSMEDEDLSNFVTYLNDNPFCRAKVEVLAANLPEDKRAALSALGITVKPYLTQEISWGKTMAWIGVSYNSDVLATTNAIQQIIDELSLKGIHHIGLLSAMGTANDKVMLNSLTEVDAVLGNADSSVNEANFSELKTDLRERLSDYKLELMNRNGQKVCMSYNSSKILTSSNYVFETNIKGEVTECDNSMYIYIDKPDVQYNDEVYSYSEFYSYVRNLNSDLDDLDYDNKFYIVSSEETKLNEEIRQLEQNYSFN